MPYIRSSIHVSVRSPQPTDFELRFFSVHDFSSAMSIDKNLSGREFAVQLLHQQIIVPELDLDAMRALPDKVLRALARAWATEFMRADVNETKRSLPALERFKQTYLSYEQRHVKRALEVATQVTRSYEEVVRSVVVRLPKFEFPTLPVLVSPVIGNSVTTLTPLFHQIGAVLDQYRPSALWQEAFRDLSNTLRLSNTVYQHAQFAETLKSVVTTLNIRDRWIGQSFGRMADIAQLIDTHPTVLEQMSKVISSVLSVPNAFAVLSSEMAKQLEGVGAIAEAVREDLIIPAHTTAVVLDTVHLTGTRLAGVAEQPRSVQVTQEQTQRAGISIRLSALKPHFAAHWEEAWLSLSTETPVRLIHAAHSGREVLRQVLEYLAPDEGFSEQEIRENGHNGQVTRKMRVARILGTRVGSSRVEFIEQVAKSVDALFACLSADAHNETGQIAVGEVEGLLGTLGGILMWILGVQAS